MQSNLSLTGIQPLINDSDDLDNKIDIKGVLWSPIRLKRTLEEAAANNLTTFSIVRISFNCMAPLKLVDQKWYAKLIDEIEGTVPKIEKTTAMLEVVRCKTAVPFNLTCQKIENDGFECNVTLSGEECPYCIAFGHEKKLDELCGKLLKNPQQPSAHRDDHLNEDAEDAFKWVFDSQNHVNAVLNFVCKDRRVMHQINWMRFCFNVRTSLYAAIALECSNNLFQDISGQSPFSLCGVVFPMPVVSVLTDLKNFQNSVIGYNATNLHNKAIQGTF